MAKNHPWRTYKAPARSRADRIVLSEDNGDVPRYRTFTVRKVDDKTSDAIKRIAQERGCTIAEALDFLVEFHAEVSAEKAA